MNRQHAATDDVKDIQRGNAPDGGAEQGGVEIEANGCRAEGKPPIGKKAEELAREVIRIQSMITRLSLALKMADREGPRCRDGVACA